MMVQSGMSHASRLTPRLVWAVDVIVLAGLYVGGAQLRLFFPFTESGPSWVWIPSGVSLAALLLRGRDRWPGVALGALASSTLSDWHWPSAFLASAYAAGEALLATSLLTWRGPFDRGLQSVGSVLRFFLAALLAASLTAVAGSWNLVSVSPRAGGVFGEVWLTFTVGDAVAMLTITPALLVWGGTRVRFAGRWRRVEFAALLTAAYAVGALVFGQQAWPVHIVLPMVYTTFPLMVWGAFRFGQPGVTAVTTLVATLALVGSGAGFGPFALALDRMEATLVAGFMSIVCVTALMLAALVQERAQAQSERRTSEARFRAFMQHSPAVAFMKSSDGRYVFGNDAWAAQFGKRPEALIGQTDFDLWPEDSAAAFQASDRQALMSRTPVELVESGVRHDGGVHWWTTLKFVIEQDDGAPLIGGIALDITPRMRAEQALRASEDRYRSLVELATSVIVVVDDAGRITEFNREAEAFFGISRLDALGRDYVECCVSEAQREQVAADLARIRAGEALQGRESAFVQRDGTHKAFLWNATRLTDSRGEAPQLLVIGQDISELRRLEHQLLLAQRMEGIGRLAGGIAHDFNNLLTAILGHAEMAQDDVAPTDPARGNIAEITRAAQRAADLTRQLLAFARRQIIEPRIVDLNGLVLNVDRMLRRLLGEDIELVTVQDPDLWRVRIDPGQFEQVLVNLAVNARDAMPAGGTLVIETRNVHLDEEFARQHATVQPGPHVLLAVSDTGVGMDAEVLAHIFEPFFTTKEVGKGTGLGLATCYGIVKQNRGSIWVDSERAIGTTFRIYLPRADAVVVGAEPVEARVPEQTRGTETVLLVEDEVLVRNLAADALRRHGYQVLSASTGVEALELASQMIHPIDVLVTDVVMPQMGGEQLAVRLLGERPSLKVLFISGYTDMAVLQHGTLIPGTALLQKPFTPGQLVHRVRQLLDTDSGPSQSRLPLTTH
jgi:PAS domain S-box-containing protein